MDKIVTHNLGLLIGEGEGTLGKVNSKISVNGHPEIEEIPFSYNPEGRIYSFMQYNTGGGRRIWGTIRVRKNTSTTELPWIENDVIFDPWTSETAKNNILEAVVRYNDHYAQPNPPRNQQERPVSLMGRALSMLPSFF